MPVGICGDLQGLARSCWDLWGHAKTCRGALVGTFRDLQEATGARWDEFTGTPPDSWGSTGTCGVLCGPVRIFCAICIEP